MFKEALATKITQSMQKLMTAEVGAYPCFYCAKKFKASEFVVKHIDNKHSTEEKYLQVIEKVINPTHPTHSPSSDQTRAATMLELYS